MIICFETGDIKILHYSTFGCDVAMIINSAKLLYSF